MQNHSFDLQSLQQKLDQQFVQQLKLVLPLTLGLKLELAEQFADFEQQVLALPRQLAHRLQLSFALQHWRWRLLVLACFQPDLHQPLLLELPRSAFQHLLRKFG